MASGEDGIGPSVHCGFIYEQGRARLLDDPEKGRRTYVRRRNGSIDQFIQDPQT
jgi:hypothetical protein